VTQCHPLLTFFDVKEHHSWIHHVCSRFPWNLALHFQIVASTACYGVYLPCYSRLSCSSYLQFNSLAPPRHVWIFERNKSFTVYLNLISNFDRLHVYITHTGRFSGRFVWFRQVELDLILIHHQSIGDTLTCLQSWIHHMCIQVFNHLRWIWVCIHDYSNLRIKIFDPPGKCNVINHRVYCTI